MTAVSFYVQVVKALDEIGAPYMIVGAFGGYPFGITRVTFDIDILVDLREPDFEALSQKFPLPRYYADPEMMRNSVQMGIMFNIIDTSEGIKADLVPLKREPEYLLAFDRRIRREFIDPTGNSFSAWSHNHQILSSENYVHGTRADQINILKTFMLCLFLI
jgi:hypothetical protein